MSRSMSKSASMRLTASSATGEILWAGLPLRTAPAMSANSKTLRRAWLQQSALAPGLGARPGR